MSIPVTEQSVINAAKKSKQAALESGIKKYTYFATCTYTQFIDITPIELNASYCALCVRYQARHNWRCPLAEDFCGGGHPIYCSENSKRNWKQMCESYDAGMYADFQLYASAILVKLLKLAGKI